LLLVIGLTVRAQQDFRQRVAAGEQMLASGNYASALAEFEIAGNVVRSVEVNPHEGMDVLLRLAEVRLLNSEYRAAEQLARRIDLNQPDVVQHARIQLLLSKAREVDGDMPGALHDAQEALLALRQANDPRSISALAQHAHLLNLTGAWEESGKVLSSCGTACTGATSEIEVARTLAVIELDYGIGRYDQAFEAISKALDKYSEAPGHSAVLQLRLWRGRVELAQGRPRAAVEELSPLPELFDKALPAHHPLAAIARIDAAEALLANREGLRAAPLFWDAVRRLDSWRANQPLGALRALAEGQASRAEGKYAESAAHYESAQAAFKGLFGESSLDARFAALDLAEAAVSAGRYQDTEPMFQRLLAGVRAPLDSHHAIASRAEFGLLSMYNQQKNWPAVERAYQDWRERRWPQAEPDLTEAMALEWRAGAARAGNDSAMAERCLAGALTIRQGAGPAVTALEIALQLGDIRAGQGRQADAAQALSATLAAFPPEAIPLEQRITAYERLGSWDQAASQPGNAADALLKARQLLAGSAPAGDPRLARLSGEASENLTAAGRKKEAEEILVRELQLLDSQHKEKDDQTLRIASALGSVELDQREYASAVASLSRVYEAARENRGPGAENRPLMLETLAAALAGAGRPDDAAKLLIDRARISLTRGAWVEAGTFAAQAQDLCSSQPNSLRGGEALIVLAETRTCERKYDEAQNLFLRALPIVKTDTPSRLICLNGLARLAINRKDYEQAGKYIDEAKRLLPQAGDVDATIEASLVSTEAALSLASGKRDEALELYRKFLAMEARAGSLQTLPLLDPLAEAARAFSLSGRIDIIEEINQRRLHESERTFGDSSPEAAWNLYAIGDFYAHQRRFADGQNYYERALELFVRLKGEKSDESATVLGALADSYFQQKNYAMAVTQYRRAIDVYQTVGKPAATAGLLRGLASALRMSGDYMHAKETFDQVADMALKEGIMNQDRSAALLNGILCLVEAGDIAEATRDFDALRRDIRSANRNRDSLIERDALYRFVDVLNKVHRPKEADAYEKELKRLERRLGSTAQ